MDRQRTSNFYTLVYLTIPLFATGVLLSPSRLLQRVANELCSRGAVRNMPYRHSLPRGTSDAAQRSERCSARRTARLRRERALDRPIQRRCAQPRTARLRFERALDRPIQRRRAQPPPPAWLCLRRALNRPVRRRRRRPEPNSFFFPSPHLSH